MRGSNSRDAYYEAIAGLWRDLATVFGLIATFSAVLLNIGNPPYPLTNGNPTSPYFVGNYHNLAWPLFVISAVVVGVSLVLMTVFDVKRIRAARP